MSVPTDEIYIFTIIAICVSFLVSYWLRDPGDIHQELAARLWWESFWERWITYWATRRAKTVKDSIEGNLVLGSYVKGDLYQWVKSGLVLYPKNVLDKHAVVIGASGKGKTETLLRIAYGAAKVLGWKVYFVDAKGDPNTAPQFLAVMKKAGIPADRMAMFPARAYDGWRGNWLDIYNRLLKVESFTEPYYEGITKKVISLALKAPQGLPKSSTEFLQRLNLEALTSLYAGHPDLSLVKSLTDKDFNGVNHRYHAFFNSLEGKLDGHFAFEDVDAGYFLLKGLSLEDVAQAAGRFLVKDFTSFIDPDTKRKKDNRQCLLIIDEYSALAEKTDAANLFDRIRSFGGSVIVTAQGYAGLGEKAQADRMIGAASTVILHQCPDPENIVALAGTRKRMEPTIQFDDRGSKATGSAREQETFKIPPNEARTLGVGHAFFISGGKWIKTVVARVEVSPAEIAQVKPLCEPEPVAPAAIGTATEQTIIDTL